MPDAANPNDTASKSNQSYVVVARRYRPRGFSELVGQEHVGQALKNAIETSRVGHAYLFTGARGVGKTSTARIFAKALNDPGGPTATPDNNSDVAQAIDAGEDIDVIEIDGASNRGIDEIRSLRANVGVRPSRSRYKIYIIDEVHMLTGAAFNALLKTLEEPPEHVKFIFCTTDPEKLPITVLSRCQRFDFAPVEVPKIVGRLREIITAENAEADDAALELIARRASGSMRDSQSLLEQVLSFSSGRLTAADVHSMLGTADDERLHALALAMAGRDAPSALRQLDEAIDAGVDAGRIAEQLLGYFRDLMAVTVGCDESLQRHTSVAMHAELKQLGDQWGLQTVLAVVGLIDHVLVRIRHSVYGRVLLESTLIQICHLPDLQAIANLAEAAGDSLEKKNLTANSTRSDAPTASVPSTSNSSTGPNTTGPNPTPAAVAHAAAEKTINPPHLPSANDEQGAKPPTPQPAFAAAPAASMTGSAAGASTVSATGTSAQPTASEHAVATASLPTYEGEKQSLNQQSIAQVWQTALQHVETLTATLAAMASKVELVGEREIRLTFPAGAMALRRVEAPEHKSSLAHALTSIVGHPVNLTLAAGAPSDPVVAPKAQAKKLSGKEKLDRMRQIESHPMVQACKEAFGAEVVKIDQPY
ncbi:DNA polymerase III subunit gamma/tau [Stieleria varia]|uniref:DNA polymerase III subunit gamma/tau n=1 Tax=Stieleria varia TaxID=2528005 RepID=A0A5C6AU06_9BACT|nr:DNA polymerase III subunit gamma/tau [Stieleria varia]TWU02689.1 DNA polymerase III subunit tau [Stieleria varia]